MKFFIDSSRYFSREEEGGALSLINRTTNAVQFFNRGARRILNACDAWIDLDEFVDLLPHGRVPREKVYADYESLLYQLDAIGLADLEDRPADARDGAFEAKAPDYGELSCFLMANIVNANSCGIATNPAYYGRNVLLPRLRGGSARYMVLRREGKIAGVLEFSTRRSVFSPNAISLESVYLDGSLTREACDDAVKELLDASAAVLSGSYRKIRYAYLAPRQDGVRRNLLENGFVKTAEIPDELRNGKTLITYDRNI